MKRLFSILLTLCLLCAVLPALPARAAAAGDAWDGTVDISWYDPDKTEFYLSTPAQLAGLAALVNGMTDPTCPKVIGDAACIQSIRVDDYTLVGAGGGNVSDTVYTSAVDFAYKTVYLTADMDMGGRYDAATDSWSGPNWTPVAGKFPMKPEEVAGDCLTLDTRFNGVLDGQGHSIRNLYCSRYAQKGFPYSMAVGVVGFLGGTSDTQASQDTVTTFAGGWQPAVRNLVLESGSVLGRRMIGGIVGRIGKTSNGVVIENCANFARVKSTDAKGVGGIVGSAWGDGVVRGCYNGGCITTTYSSPAGGIVGTNEGVDIYNCYNYGVIDTNGQSRGRGIGSHSAGVYTVENCYSLAGSGDDAENPVYYKGISQKIRVDVAELTEAQLKSAETLAALNASGLVFAADVRGINNGYPVLWFQNGCASSGTCKITLKQADGGTISLEGNAEVPFGQTVTLRAEPLPGYTLDHFTVSGAPIAADFFTPSSDVEVSAVFKKLVTVTVTIPESGDFYVAVSRAGWKLEGDEMVWTDRELLRSGDTLLEGNVLTVLTHGYADAAPDDLDREYIDAYACDLPGTQKNANGTYTVTGSADVAISVSRSTQAKSWISLADTDWYVRGGRKSEYTITTAAELAGLAYLVNKNGVSFEGLTVKLGADISLRNADGTVGRRVWTPIGASLGSAFKGSFDGQGYAVYDMTAESGNSYAGLFGVCVDAEIRNLSVYGTVSGTARSSYAAGVAAYVRGGAVENCLNYADVTASGIYAGGIAAMLTEGARVSACFNYGKISAQSGLGGVVGVSESGEDRIEDCANFGDIISTGSGTYGTGGIAGRLAGEILRCVNYGAVDGTDRYTGGVAGYTTTKNRSAVTLSANRGSVRASNDAQTAALGGVVGYAQYLTISGAISSGALTAEGGIPAGNTGELIGREGSVKTVETEETIPSYTAQPPGSFASTGGSSFTVTFTADGRTVDTVSYTAGMTSVSEPAVPQKDGYTGAWARYALGAQDLTVRAVYRPKLVRGGDTVTQSGTYFITWFSSGNIDIAPGVYVVLDGSNGGADGFDGLCIRVGQGASLTLRDMALGGETTMLSLSGGNTLTLAGDSALSSRADAQDNAEPTIRVSGDLVIDGSGSLYVSAGIRNAAIYVDKPGSTIELRGGTLSVYKEDLLGFAGGAFCADGSKVIVSGGTLRGHTVSDNVAVLSADSVTMTGGRLLLQCERSPEVILGPVTAAGGTIAAYGHSGNSAASAQAYSGRSAIPGYSGSAAFEDFLPFQDVFVTDGFYDAVAYCYEHGYFDGTSETTFSPDKSMNRAMFVTVLYRLAGKPAVGAATTPFTDLTQDWYKDAVAWAVAQGITDGTSETTFSPTNPVTREQAAVFLYRFAALTGDTLPRQAEASTEHGAFSAWAEAEALWALSGGLFSGARGEMAVPSDYAPRSLLASVLLRYDQFKQ